MSGWSWAAVYPGRQTVTLVLDADEAAAVMEAAARAGRLIAPGTVLGLPETAQPSSPPPVGAGHGAPKPAPRPSPAARPATPAASGGGIRALARPAADPPSATLRQVDPTTRALIDRAIADGRVTRCPPCKHSVEPGAPDPSFDWRTRGRRRRRA